MRCRYFCHRCGGCRALALGQFDCECEWEDCVCGEAAIGAAFDADELGLDPEED
jgi:hypothetical protein